MKTTYEDFTLANYVEWLVSNNQVLFNTQDLGFYTNSFGFGLVEEVFEAKEAYQNKAGAASDLEVGDVIAYGTLLLSLVEQPELVVERLGNLSRSFVYTSDKHVQSFCNFMKKHSRNDFSLVDRKQEFEALVLNLMSYAMSLTQMPVSDICWLNYQKLLARVDSGTFRNRN